MVEATIHYLSEAEAMAHAPTPLAAVDLVERALRAIASSRVTLAHHVLHPRAHTGLSAIIGIVADGDADLAGQKWVSESPTAGVVAHLFMNDPETGVLTAVLGARGLTGLRTAAVSGACVRALAPDGPVALVGTGLQCRSHLTVLDALGRRDVRIAYRRRESADAVAEWAAIHVPWVRVSFHERAADALAGAGTVITMVTRGATDARIDVDWLRADALVLPVDFAHCIESGVAHTAELVATDHPQTYAEVHAHGGLPGYPRDVQATGAALDWRRRGGRIVIQNLGNAAGDLLIGEAVLNAARARGVGRALPR